MVHVGEWRMGEWNGIACQPTTKQNDSSLHSSTHHTDHTTHLFVMMRTFLQLYRIQKCSFEKHFYCVKSKSTNTETTKSTLNSEYVPLTCDDAEFIDSNETKSKAKITIEKERIVLIVRSMLFTGTSFERLSPPPYATKPFKTQSNIHTHTHTH
jgi:hypothetical protein